MSLRLPPVTLFILAIAASGWSCGGVELPAGPYACASAADCAPGWACAPLRGGGGETVCTSAAELVADSGSSETAAPDTAPPAAAVLDGAWFEPDRETRLELDQEGQHVTGTLIYDALGGAEPHSFSNGRFEAEQLTFSFETWNGDTHTFELAFDADAEQLAGTWRSAHIYDEESYTFTRL